MPWKEGSIYDFQNDDELVDRDERKVIKQKNNVNAVYIFLLLKTLRIDLMLSLVLFFFSVKKCEIRDFLLNLRVTS